MSDPVDVKKIANLQRKISRLSVHIADLVNKGGARQMEIRRLTELLLWIHKTGQPIEEIRRVIERSIPNALRLEATRREVKAKAAE